MRSWRLHSLCLVSVLLACGTARAQDHGQAGITMAYPASVGVIWHAAPGVAIRPDFTFATSRTEGQSVSTDSWTIGVGGSALFYVGSSDRVRPYFSPRIGYARSSASSDSSLPLESSAHAWSFSGSFGAEYSAVSKFSVFGEVGVNFSRQTGESGISGIEMTSRTTGMRAGVGVIFYP
jgi:hypothetical protein